MLAHTNGLLEIGGVGALGGVDLLGNSTNPFRIAQAITLNPGNNPKRNDVVCFGYNVHPESVRKDGADHAFGMWIEAAYGPNNGKEQVEYYLQGIATNGVINRPIGVNFHRDDGLTTLFFHATNVYLSSGINDDSKPVSLRFSAEANIIAGVGGKPGKFQLITSNGAVHNGAQHYFAFDPVYGAYLDYRNLPDGKGLAVWASSSQSSPLFYARRGADTVFEVGARGGLMWRPQANSTPAMNGDLVFEATSDTSLTIKLKGSDGMVRSVALALA